MELYRKYFKPVVPHSLSTLEGSFSEIKHECLIEEGIQKLFAHLAPCSVRKYVPTNASTQSKTPLKMGVVFSGGPAPGGHNVVVGLFDALKEWHPESCLIGFIHGPKGVLRNTCKELGPLDIDSIRNTGGFSLLGSGRSKIESPEDIEKAITTAVHQDLDGLVIIGGDDSNTDAAVLAETFLQRNIKTVVVGVPKTIDGDLQSEDIAISFGFDTACKVYSEMIGNIAIDALSSKKYYYFIRLMGRVASHITLECALQTHPNLALISEEVAARSLSLQDVVDEIVKLIVDRDEAGKHYGLILIPEGLVEHLKDVKEVIMELNELSAPSSFAALQLASCRSAAERLDFVFQHLSSQSKDCLGLFPRHIAEQLLHERDPHGNVPVSLIETERLLAELVDAEIRQISQRREQPIPFAVQTAFYGYEGRSSLPSIFDSTYCYALGRLIVPVVAQNLSGYMVAINKLHEPVAFWEPLAVPLVSLLHFERRKGAQKAVIKRILVDLKGEIFARFKKERDLWRLSDSYLQPGPMQFWNPPNITE